MLQTDTIATAEALTGEEAPQELHHAKPRHPYQVVRMLPRDATDAQIDSAIQANFQPKVVRLNTRVDTLTTFGLKYNPYRDLRSVRFNQESLFAGSPYYRPELGMARPGVAGDPVPYTAGNDNVLTSLLVAIFLLTLFLISKSRSALSSQLRHFFYVPRSVSQMTQTSSEVRAQMLMVMQTGLLLSMFSFFYMGAYVSTTYFLPSQYHLIGIFLLVYMAYFMVRYVIAVAVNHTFFSKEKILQWGRTFLFLNATGGVLLFPLILLHVFFNMSMDNTVFSVAAVVIMYKILTFYKYYSIFFKGMGGFLQNILYFCALEIVPLLSVAGAVALIGDNLKINY